MNSAPKAGPAKIAVRPDNFHLWRSRKDQLASKVIGLGGFVVIAAVLLILLKLRRCQKRNKADQQVHQAPRCSDKVGVMIASPCGLSGNNT